jgi:hypothetical protein
MLQDWRRAGTLLITKTKLELFLIFFKRNEAQR